VSETWAERWWHLLTVGADGARRVTEGRGYQRSGRVTDVRIRAGLATGRVQGTRATPQLAELTVPVLTPPEWAEVVDVLVGQLRHSARLLAGLTPVGLDHELTGRGVALFPDADEVAVTCGCGEQAMPCAHVAAVWHAVATRIADDPFEWLRLRGRGREQLLADVAAARGGADGGAPDGLALTNVPADGWRRARAPLEDVVVPRADTPVTPAPPLRALGDPPGWPRGPSAPDLFSPLIEGAARWIDGLDRVDPVDGAVHRTDGEGAGGS
jgi:hypothetical protein